jgi:hypothetical protein
VLAATKACREPSRWRSDDRWPGRLREPPFSVRFAADQVNNLPTLSEALLHIPRPHVCAGGALYRDETGTPTGGVEVKGSERKGLDLKRYHAWRNMLGYAARYRLPVDPRWHDYDEFAADVGLPLNRHQWLRRHDLSEGFTPINAGWGNGRK